MQLSPLDWPGICGEASECPWESCLFPSQGLRFFSVYHTHPKLALDCKLRLEEKKEGKNWVPGSLLIWPLTLSPPHFTQVSQPCT